MRPVVKTLSAAGLSAPIPIDYHLTPEDCGIAVVLSAGASLTYNVEYSLDDPFAAYPVDYNTNATWWQHPNMTGLTASAQDVLTVPARAIRLNNTGYVSGSDTITVVQAGGIA